MNGSRIRQDSSLKRAFPFHGWPMKKGSNRLPKYGCWTPTFWVKLQLWSPKKNLKKKHLTRLKPGFSRKTGTTQRPCRFGRIWFSHFAGWVAWQGWDEVKHFLGYYNGSGYKSIKSIYKNTKMNQNVGVDMLPFSKLIDGLGAMA